MDATDPTVGLSTQRRLQRAPDFTGPRLSRFRDVFLRHGLPVLLVALIVLAVPEMRALFGTYLEPTLSAPMRHALLGVGAFALILTLSVRVGLDRMQLAWALYLGALSIWEEWVFRLVLPFALTDFVDARWQAVLLANALFGALHYFTLRWRLRWCVFAFLGGVGLSWQLRQGDFTVVALTHWVATFINTPRPPSPRPSPQT